MTHGPYNELPSYTAAFTATVAADGSSMTGTYTDGGGPTGFTYPRTTGSGGPAPPAAPTPEEDKRRPVGAIVICNRGPMPTDPSRCIVTLGDAGPPPGGPPLGTVTWRLTGPGSLGTTSCALERSAYGGTISSCEVLFRPGPAGTPAGTEIPIVADYPGSAAHRPISRAHRLIDARIIDPGTGEPAPTPGECDAAADGLKPKGKAKTKAKAKASLDNRFRDPTKDALGRPTGYKEGFFEGTGRRVAWCASSAGTAVVGGTGTLVTGGVSVVYTGAWTVGFGAAGLEVGGPLGATGFGAIGLAGGWQYGGSQLMSAANGISNATGRTLSDPPDRRFKVLAQPRTAPGIRIRAPRTAAGRRDASLLGGWLARLQSVRALSDALAATADKLGGAEQAGDRAWQDRQARHGIDLAGRLAAELDALAPVARRVAKRATTAREARAKPSARGFDQARRRLAKRGFTAAEVARLARLGFGAPERAMLLKAARDPKVPRSALLRPAAPALRDTAHAALYVQAARYLRLWAAHPGIARQAALR
jgi:hypothetical protein